MRGIALFALTLACAANTSPQAGGDVLVTEASDLDVATARCTATPSVIRVAVRDIWGRPAGKSSVTIAGKRLEGSSLPFDTSPLEIVASAEGLVEATVRVVPDPTAPLASRCEVLAGGAQTTVSLSPGCERLTFFIGLDSPFFAASGRPPTGGNDAQFLMDGEEFWASLQYDLAAAESDIRGTTWWWQSDFELVRPDGHEMMSKEERREYTILYFLDNSPAVKRILINRFLPETFPGMAYLNTDPEIRARGSTDGDNFEVIVQANRTEVPVFEPYEPVPVDFSFQGRLMAMEDCAGEIFPEVARQSALVESVDAASWHQKAFVVDGRVAYVTGMNVKSTDWDTHEHRVFDPRRMKFDTPTEERLRVAKRLQLPDLGPRKDYGIRIEGPAARAVDEVLKLRWDAAIAAGDMFAEHATPFSCLPEAPPGKGVLAQVVATMPPPIAERSILETWRKAISRAESLIYIEDQYFRMPILLDALTEALRTRPGLRLIVVTKPVAITDGGKKYTVVMDKALREAAPDRYLLLQLKSFEAVPRPDPPLPGDESAQFYFVEIDTHSKLLVVDDLYLSVGSCNKNNRGLLFEGELNVSVLDPGFVRQARTRVFRNLLGPRLADGLPEDAAAIFDLLSATAKANQETEAWWLAHGPSLTAAEVEAAAKQHAPDGFIYPLEVTDEYLMDVGPDAF